MPDIHLLTLLSILKGIGTPLTRPSLTNFVILAVGWLQSHGAHAVTEALVVADVAGRRHHEAFHRFFSRGTWDPDRLGFWVFSRLQRWLEPDGAVRIVIDDTLASKKGPQVFGIGSHLDAVRSTRCRRVFCFGHYPRRHGVASDRGAHHVGNAQRRHRRSHADCTTSCSVRRRGVRHHPP
jgi:hypothetical protein